MPSYHPTISVSAPRNWFAKESLTLLAPDGQANVIVSSEPLDPAVDTREYAETQGLLLQREFPHFEQHGYEAALVFGGHDGFLRVFSWAPPDGVAVTQIQSYCVLGSRGYTGTATTPSARYAEHEALLRETLLSAVARA